jgi:hypothetical protein
VPEARSWLMCARSTTREGKTGHVKSSTRLLLLLYDYAAGSLSGFQFEVSGYVLTMYIISPDFQQFTNVFVLRIDKLSPIHLMSNLKHFINTTKGV